MPEPHSLVRDAEIEPTECEVRSDADGMPEGDGGLLQTALAGEHDAEVVPGREHRRVGVDRSSVCRDGLPAELQALERQPEVLEEDRIQRIGLDCTAYGLERGAPVPDSDLDKRLVVVQDLRPAQRLAGLNARKVALALPGGRVLLQRVGVTACTQIGVAGLEAGVVRQVCEALGV